MFFCRLKREAITFIIAFAAAYIDSKDKAGVLPMLENSKTVVVSALKLPRDVMLGEVLVSFVGRHTVTIENYRGIILYTDTMVKLQAKDCKVIINGARLHIDYYTNEEMKITGHIKSVEFDG